MHELVDRIKWSVKENRRSAMSRAIEHVDLIARCRVCDWRVVAGLMQYYTKLATVCGGGSGRNSLRPAPKTDEMCGRRSYCGGGLNSEGLYIRNVIRHRKSGRKLEVVVIQRFVIGRDHCSSIFNTI